MLTKQRRYVNLKSLLLLIGIILVVSPVLLRTYYPYGLSLLTTILIYAIFAMSLDLIAGYGGGEMPSFGHGVFFGVAGYTTGLLTTRLITEGPGTFWLVMPISILLAALVAALIGLVLLHTRGIVFFMVTLAMGQVFFAIAWQWRSLTGGDDGLPGIVRPDLGLPWSMANSTYFYWLVLLFFILSFFLLYRIIRSPLGHALIGISESESRMQSLGYNTRNYKHLCFILAGAFAGLAGSLNAYYLGFISPYSLGITTAALVFFMMILGGAGTLFGPIIGSAIVTLLQYVVSTYTERWLLIFGIVFVLTIMFIPKGIGGYLVQRWKGLRIGA